MTGRSSPAPAIDHRTGRSAVTSRIGVASRPGSTAKVIDAQATGESAPSASAPSDRRSSTSKTSASTTRVVRPRLTHLGPGLDRRPGGRSQHLQGQVGGGHPVGMQGPQGGGAAHHVDQGGQHPGADPSVGPGDERGHRDPDPGTGLGGDLRLHAQVAEEVAGGRVAAEGHSAFLFGRTDQHLVDGDVPGPGHREDDGLGDVLGGASAPSGRRWPACPRGSRDGCGRPARSTPPRAR